MKLDTIGKNIRKFRLVKKLRQEDLAEKTDLTTNYIGMVERGEKIPSLETFIKILNALGVLLWSSIFVTLMANKIGGLQFGIYRNCQISSRVFHTAVAALPLTKANRSDFE